MELVRTLSASRAVAVVRAPALADPVRLSGELAAAGLPIVEFTYTTEGALKAVEKVRQTGESRVGMGTVLTVAQAADAVSAGAEFLVTPMLRPDVAAEAARLSVPVIIGALSPTEVQSAVDSGADAVKIFPARLGGPAYLRDLLGPFPGLTLVPSGGVTPANARAFLDAGAVAVCAGTGVLPPDAVVAGDWETLRARAAEFVAAVRP